jgi:hypothetical protein
MRKFAIAFAALAAFGIAMPLTSSAKAEDAVVIKKDRQAGFIVTIYDEDGLKLAATMPCSTPAEAFAEARKIVDNKVEGPKK